MITYPVGTRGINYQAAYNNLIIDWNARGVSVSNLAPNYQSDWSLLYPLLFSGMRINWGDAGIFSGHGHGSIASSSGNLQFVFSGASYTNGSVTAFNDGVIDVPLITITKANFPIVQACINILKDVGAVGRPYKLDVIRDGVKLFTVRSVYWGTQMATDTDPKYQVIDKQLQATANPPL